MKVFLLFLFFTRINAFLHDENDIYKYECRGFRISGACNHPFENMFFLPKSFQHIECCSSLKDWLLEDFVGRRGINKYL